MSTMELADLLGHVLTVISRIPGMLTAPAPAQADVSAVDYYRPDQRFSPWTNAERIRVAQQRAADASDGHALAVQFDRAWRGFVELCEREPDDRVVRTRHGDAMLLTDFLTTRVVELGVHGLDLAAALGCEPWLTRPAVQVLTDLLFDGDGGRMMGDLGWDDVTFAGKATGREPMTAVEAGQVQRYGIRQLALG